MLPTSLKLCSLFRACDGAPGHMKTFPHRCSLLPAFKRNLKHFSCVCVVSSTILPNAVGRFALLPAGQPGGVITLVTNVYTTTLPCFGVHVSCWFDQQIIPKLTLPFRRNQQCYRRPAHDRFRQAQMA